MTLYTIGHSNQPWERFLELVRAHEIGCVADVRAFPASRRWPHFNREPLAAALAAEGIGYQWIPALGGRRSKSRANSPHTAWTVPAFRNYADYTESEEFAAGIRELLNAAERRPTAFMCAEARYWQCHRRLIADHLTVAGHRVLHIASASSTSEHQLPDFARVAGGRIIYDGGTQGQMFP